MPYLLNISIGRILSSLCFLSIWCLSLLSFYLDFLTSIKTNGFTDSVCHGGWYSPNVCQGVSSVPQVPVVVFL